MCILILKFHFKILLLFTEPFDWVKSFKELVPGCFQFFFTTVQVVEVASIFTGGKSTTSLSCLSSTASDKSSS